MQLVVSDKSGFVSFDDIVNVFDDRGVLFYHKLNKHGKLHFNLPSGIYSTTNNISKAPIKKYRENVLPKANAVKKLPVNGFKIVYINNPHKCSVNSAKHIIYFDHSFKTAPLPVKDYIKFHELGHYFYSGKKNESEKACDLFAANQMLKIGYNPSQIVWAQGGTLTDSETSLERKTYVKNNFKNYY